MYVDIGDWYQKHNCIDFARNFLFPGYMVAYSIYTQECKVKIFFFHTTLYDIIILTYDITQVYDIISSILFCSVQFENRRSETTTILIFKIQHQ